MTITFSNKQIAKIIRGYLRANGLTTKGSVTFRDGTASVQVRREKVKSTPVKAMYVGTEIVAANADVTVCDVEQGQVNLRYFHV